MEKAQTKTKKGLMSVLFKLIVAAAAVYLFVSFVSGQLALADKQHELEEISARLELQVQTNQEMMRLTDEDNEDAYVERVAREKLGYARANERVFVDLGGE